jgi:hypothetical protein
MGRSAKFYKKPTVAERNAKKTRASGTEEARLIEQAAAAAARGEERRRLAEERRAEAAEKESQGKKKRGIKAKIGKAEGAPDERGRVLGGADYLRQWDSRAR